MKRSKGERRGSGRESVPRRQTHWEEGTMDSVTFKRIARDEWRVYHDGDIVGDVCRQEDILREGEHYYVLHLSEDHRGPVTGARPRTRP